MSYGLTPYDFVQQVFYAQEKVLLDFFPSDDKYKEVLVEANLVLQELQKEEDWTWLRRRLVLGSVGHVRGGGAIPEFQLPDWVYKPSTLHNDCVTLHNMLHICNCHDCSKCGDECIDEYGYIEVPYVSTGRLRGRSLKQTSGPLTNVPNVALGAGVIGQNILTFNRPLTVFESYNRVAVADVQARIPQFHVCTPACKGVNGGTPDYTRDANGNFTNPCAQIEPIMLTEIPDPNYVVIRTACLHAEGSPPAQGRIAGLQDNAQKLLSAMRANDAANTDADIIDWAVPTFVRTL